MAGTATLPIGDRWSLLGKLGVTRNDADFAGAERKTSTLAGVGMGYAFLPNVGLGLEYEDYGKLASAGVGSDNKGRNVALSLKYAL